MTMTQAIDDTVSLPEGFEDLERFVDFWAVETMAERMARRFAHDGDARRAFYGAMAPRLQAAIDRLGAVGVERAMSAPERRLKQLVLAMAEVALTIEIYDPEIEARHSRSNRQIHILKELDAR